MCVCACLSQHHTAPLAKNDPRVVVVVTVTAQPAAYAQSVGSHDLLLVCHTAAHTHIFVWGYIEKIACKYAGRQRARKRHAPGCPRLNLCMIHIAKRSTRYIYICVCLYKHTQQPGHSINDSKIVCVMLRRFSTRG